MIEAVIALSVVALAQFVLLAYAFKALEQSSERAARERRELEDRFMSVTQPLALTQVDAVRRGDDGPANIEYVDEARELELQEE